MRKLIFFVLFVALIGAGIVYFQRTHDSSSPSSSSAETPAQAEETPLSLEVDPNAPKPEADDFFIGNADAPLTVIEYFSLSCPHCAQFAKEILPKIKSTYIDQGKIRWILRDYPLNKPALEAAMVARCQSPLQYVGMLDYLFQTADQWLVQDPTPVLAKLAKNAGMDEPAFQKCISDESLRQKIIGSRASASVLGVNATPTFFANGVRISGSQSFEKFQATFDALLHNKK